MERRRSAASGSSVDRPTASNQGRLPARGNGATGTRSAYCLAATFSLDLTYPVGRSVSEANLARARLQQSQNQRNIQALELDVATQVREAARNVTTNAKRVDATRASRALAEKRLEAEEKRFQAGLTSSFFVLQAQRDLNVARNSELLALVEYAKSVVNYTAVQQVPLVGQ